MRTDTKIVRGTLCLTPGMMACKARRTESWHDDFDIPLLRVRRQRALCPPAHDRLTLAGFCVCFDRVSMPSRQFAFYQEIRDAIADCDRLVLVFGPAAMAYDYVGQEWRFVYFEALKCVNPIVRLNGQDGSGHPIDGYTILPRELALIQAEDFRHDAEFDAHLANYDCFSDARRRSRLTHRPFPVS